MRKIVFFSALLGLSSAWAQQTWPGFKKASELNLPFQAYAENAVVKVISFSALATANDRPTIVNVKNEPRVTNTQKLRTDIRVLQIETCRNQGLEKCPVYSYSARGTGFFKNGTQLTACRHSFHNWLVMAAEANDRSVESLTPPMWIYNSQNDLIYNSAEMTENNLMHFSFINTDDGLNFIHHAQLLTQSLDLNFKRSDIVELISSQPLTPVLSYSLRNKFSQFTQGLKVYTAGYPSKSQVFPNGKGDSNGENLMVTTGNVLVGSQSEMALLSSNFSFPGGSGSPLMDESGAVLGVVCTAKENQSPHQRQALSLVYDKTALESMWNLLSF